MARCLRPRENKTYVNDLPPETVALVATPKKQRIKKWSPNDDFDIEIVKEISPNEVEVHFTGYANSWDQVIQRDAVIIKQPPPPMKGPKTLEDFVSLLKREVTLQLKTSNHQMPDRKIAFETSQEVLVQLRQTLNAEFTGCSTVEFWKPLLGENFHLRYLNADGDYGQISSNIRCRIKCPPPEVVFEPVPNSTTSFIEHRLTKNPIFVFQFVFMGRAAQLPPQNAENVDLNESNKSDDLIDDFDFSFEMT